MAVVEPPQPQPDAVHGRACVGPVAQARVRPDAGKGADRAIPPLAVLAMLVALGACSGPSRGAVAEGGAAAPADEHHVATDARHGAAGAPGTAGPSEPRVSADPPLPVVEGQTLAFVDPAQQRRFVRARACFAARAGAAVHDPLARHGNFVEEGWCAGPRAEVGCQGETWRSQVGVRWDQLGTLMYEHEWPAVFGVQVDSGLRPASGGWNVQVWAASGGRTVLGEGLQVTWSRGEHDDVVRLSDRMEHTIERTTLVVDAEGGPWEVFERLRASPAALQQEGQRQLRALEAKVLAALEANEVLACEYGPYEGRGIPPRCVRERPLAKDAADSARAAIRGETRRQLALLDAHAAELHAALVELAGPECL